MSDTLLPAAEDTLLADEDRDEVSDSGEARSTPPLLFTLFSISALRRLDGGFFTEDELLLLLLLLTENTRSLLNNGVAEGSTFSFRDEKLDSLFEARKVFRISALLSGEASLRISFDLLLLLLLL